MRYVVLTAVLTLAAAGIGGVLQHRIRRSEAESRARSLTGGEPERGRTLARTFGCVACHVMPGIRGPAARVGPPLEKFGLSRYVAGAAENTPENLIRFLQDPRSVAPKSAMPHLRLTESNARDLAAYLYAQR